MNIDEIIQQPGQKERALRNDILKSIHVAIPGEVVSYDSTQRTAVIQPVIREWNSTENPPLLLDVPVFFYGNLLFTPTKGDGCLVVCADSCIDSWIQSGGVSTPIVARNHSMSDGFAFVGFRSTKEGMDIQKEINSKKNKQAIVIDPLADGTGLEFIDSIAQDEQGVIMPHKCSVSIANNITTEDEGFVLDARQGKILKEMIYSAFSNIGTVTTGTNASSMSVSASQYVALSSMTLDAGTYVITAGFDWSTSFTALSILGIGATSTGSILNGALVRNTGEAGGGMNASVVRVFTAQQSLYLLAYQSSGNSQTAQHVDFRAVRIK